MFVIALLIICIPVLVILILLAYARVLFRTANLPCRQYSDKIRTVSVNGFDLCYKETGVKTNLPSIIVLHGGPGMSGCYFRNTFEFLEKRYHIVSYDQRGSGFSQFKPGRGHYTLDEFVNELEAIRKLVAKSDKIIVIAHSFGGLIAMKYASKYGRHLEKMVLLSPLSKKISSFNLMSLGLSMMFRNGFPPFGPEAMDNWLLSALPDLFASSFYNKKNIGLLDIGHVCAATMAEAIYSIRSLDFQEIFKKIAVKTLITSGKSEWINSPEKDHLELQNKIQNSRLVEFSKSGHWAFLEEPDKFRTTITHFLEVD